MPEDIAVTIQGLIEIARLGKFPQSAFASKTVWRWSINYGVDNSLHDWDAAFEYFGLETTVEEMGELTDAAVAAGLNEAMATAANDREAFIRACSLVYISKFHHDRVDGPFFSTSWRFWEGYDEADLADLDYEALGRPYWGEAMPNCVHEYILQYADPEKKRPFRAISDDVFVYVLVDHVYEFEYTDEILEEMINDYSLAIRPDNPHLRAADDMRKRALAIM